MTDKKEPVKRLPLDKAKVASKKHVAAISLNYLDFVLIALVFVVALVGALWGEKIAVNDGLGWDGYIYGNIARDFSIRNIFNLQLDAYTIQRILPAVVVHYALRLLQSPFSTPNIALGFALLNVILLTLSALAWCLICNKLRMNSVGKLIGFLGIFGSFALTKWVSFYPVLTDTGGFAISMGMLYFYLSKKKAFLLFLTLVGAFTWPTLIYEGLLFLFFQKNNNNNEDEWSPVPNQLNARISFMFSIILLLGLLWAIAHHDPNVLVPPYESLITNSILVTVLYWFFALAMLLDKSRFFNLRYWLGQVRPVQWLIILLCTVAIKAVQRLIAPTINPFTDPVSILSYILLEPVAAPGKFFVSHLFFFGPVFFFALFWWKLVTRFVQDQGLGLVLNMVLGLFFLLDSESRCAINFFPLFILPVAYVADSFYWRPREWGIFALLTVIFSRVWLPLNEVPNLIARMFPFFLHDKVYMAEQNAGGVVPDVFYWMSIGPWTSPHGYILETALAIPTGCLLYFLVLRPLSRRTVHSGDG